MLEKNPIKKGGVIASFSKRLGFRSRNAQNRTPRKLDKDRSPENVTSNAEIFSTHINLNTYFANLHNYLGKYCFISGAYVIEDNDHYLLKFLMELKPRTVTVKSHTSFMKGNDRPVSINNKVVDYNTLYEHDINLMLRCYNCYGENSLIPVRNLKWYPFQDEINKQYYIYAKFEGWPTVNVEHVSRAIDRYILLNPGYKNDHCPPAREDCTLKQSTLAAMKGKPSRICTQEDDMKYDTDINPKRTCDPEACRIRKPMTKPHNFSYYSIDETPVEIVESHKRSGDEFFIPHGVSNFLLKNPGIKMMFTYKDNTVTITPGTKMIVRALDSFGEDIEPTPAIDRAGNSMGSPVDNSMGSPVDNSLLGNMKHSDFTKDDATEQVKVGGSNVDYRPGRSKTFCKYRKRKHRSSKVSQV